MITPEQIAAPNTEGAHQAAFFCWCQSMIAVAPSMRWVHAVPNGGERNAIVASRMKAEGVRPGIWDVFLPQPCGRWAGLYIEFKKPGRENEKDGGLSEQQIAFREWGKNWYAYEVCYTWQQGAEAVRKYLTQGFQ